MFEFLMSEIKKLILEYYNENNVTYSSTIERVIEELVIWKSQ